MVRYRFDEEMIIETLPITPLQIFCKIILNSGVIIQSMLGADDGSLRVVLSIDGQVVWEVAKTIRQLQCLLG